VRRLVDIIGAVLFVGLFPALLWAEEPELGFVYPLGSQKGSRFQAEVEGKNLDGAYAVRFDCDELRAQVKKVEIIRSEGTEKEDNEKQRQRLILEVEIDRAALLGAHTFQVISPQGISNPLSLQVNAETVISEGEASHSKPENAQAVSFPVVINGKIGQPGEVDYYAIEVPEDQKLMFEVITGGGLLAASSRQALFTEPKLTLYEGTGSWFDPLRVTPLMPEDRSIMWPPPQRRTDVPPTYLPRLIHRFVKNGRYVIEVMGFDGTGGPDHCYQLRMVLPSSEFTEDEKWTPRQLAHSDSFHWQSRKFPRKLESDRLARLWSRTVWVPEKEGEPTSEGAVSSGTKGDVADAPDERKALHPDLSSPSTSFVSVREREPNDSTHQAQAVEVPTLVEGEMQESGDVDYFKFHVGQGDKLVLEVETPQASRPYFSPRLAVLDADGKELVTNIYREVGGDGDDWEKSVEPVTIFTLDQKGEHYLEIRDLALRSSRPGFNLTYRLLIRPQVPHVGKIHAMLLLPRGGAQTPTPVDRINLIAGQTKNLMVVCNREEGFRGNIALAIENLPQGVRAFPALALFSNPKTGFEDRGAIHRERFRPEGQASTLVLIASEEAPATRMPQFIRLLAQPIVEGEPGTPFSFQEIPLMVVSGREK
jgi:hypothetical protein